MEATPSAARASERIQVIEAPKHFFKIDVQELWAFRDLFVFLTWRNIIIKYKQAMIGLGWAIIQPLLTMVVFTVIFGKLAKLPSGDVPYPILTFVGVLPWQFFSDATSQTSNAVVQSSKMVTKIYFPRLVLPTTTMLGCLTEFFIAGGILVLLMGWYGYPPSPRIVWFPALLGLLILFALGVGLWLAALNVRYRDVKYAVPFMLRLGIYVSPVGFASSTIPAEWQSLFALNPMVGIIDGFRWTILGQNFDHLAYSLGMSAAVTGVVFLSGLYFFNRTQHTFADVI